MTILPLTVADLDALPALVSAFLTEHFVAGGEYDARPVNVGYFVRLAAEGIAAHDPCVGAFEHAALVGFSLARGVPTVAAVPRDRVCTGLGTYVVPAYRRQGVGTMLRAVGDGLAKAKGYTRLDGVAFDAGGVASATANGWHPVGTYLQRRL